MAFMERDWKAEEGGYARVARYEPGFLGKIGRITCVEGAACGVWVGLEINGEEQMFREDQLDPAPTPKEAPCT